MLICARIQPLSSQISVMRKTLSLCSTALQAAGWACLTALSRLNLRNKRSAAPSSFLNTLESQARNLHEALLASHFNFHAGGLDHQIPPRGGCRLRTSIPINRGIKVSMHHYQPIHQRNIVGQYISHQRIVVVCDPKCPGPQQFSRPRTICFLMLLPGTNMRLNGDQIALECSIQVECAFGSFSRKMLRCGLKSCEQFVTRLKQRHLRNFRIDSQKSQAAASIRREF
mmetsp:Transcript_28636/g.97552  ORF Transcript_28636/g.97552 Transcript_28636/m.97552 type:complete len:227 (-) Transcript_28636:1276-1956(-)